MNQHKCVRYFVQMLAMIAGVLLVYLIYREFLYPVQEADTYSLSMVLIIMVIYLSVLAFAGIVVRRLSDRALQMIAIALIAIAGAVQLCIACGMQLQPSVDLLYILDQDRSMVENGVHRFSDRSYFASYTNNIGIAIVVYWVFRVANVLGCSNYELAGGIFNVLMNMVTYICAYRIASRFYNKRVSVLFLFYLVTNPALYAYASYYYTDTVSMAMTMMAVDSFTGAWRMENGCRRKVILYALSGFVLLFAFRVGATSIFILAAAVVCGFLRKDLRQTARVALPVALGFLAATLCYSGIYHYHIDYDTQETAVPWQHWVAMGANPETQGRYLDSDYIETMAQPSHDDMVTMNVQKWKERVRENGIVGNVTLVLNKEAVVWSYGDKMYWQYVHDVKEYTPIYEWIAGGYSEYFRNGLLAANALLLILMLANVIGILMSTGIKGAEHPPHLLARSRSVLCVLGGSSPSVVELYSVT